MNKTLVLSLATIALLGTNLNAESMYTKFQALEDEMKSLKLEVSALKSAKKIANSKIEDDEDKIDAVEVDKDSEEAQEDEEKMDVEAEIEDIHGALSELNKATSGNHLKFGVDYRFALDNMQYKMADGSEENNDAFMTNRLWINMDWATNENLSFTGQLAYNKAFGARSGASTGNNFETFDWIANENAYDDTIRVRSAYFLYRNDTFFETEVPWTFSIGRRPSTNGHLINLRDDDQATSPMGHAINVEFDGLSAKFSFDNWVNGMYVKFCAGRGMSNAAPKFAAAPYSTVDSGANPDIDLIGLIFVPYDNGQYAIATQYYFANNLIDDSDGNATTPGFDTVGGLHSATINFKTNGIGNEISNFLDDTTFFVSGAMSVTNPDGGKGMLGSAQRKAGYSAWAGLQFPSLISDYGRWGLEYNYGSKYWRSITYGEDTNIGSKMATRGSAYEAYFTEYLVDDILSLQVRYTYIDYNYSGSNGFFGNTTGAAMKIADVMDTPMGNIAGSVVDTAQDIRFYLRYKY
ncbi:MAG: hypothetical protein AUK54_08290 [Helicobacteraceae bacterium CG2_30_36_10]|nr:MAG: hypothetical protein AUK54_08290 [Helicobacteraceae bacterium CG2_30_36_10]